MTDSIFLGAPDLPASKPRSDRWLSEGVENRYSQNGEDGLLVRLLEFLPDADGWCCEFGAWDGRVHSNSRRLIEEHQYQAVLIAGDAERHADLCRHYQGDSRIHSLNRFVHWSGENRLDALLAQTPIPRRFDFLIIDVDGTEYHIWSALQDYQPKVVCVEFNASIPDFVDYVQPADPLVGQGNSLEAFVRLAKEKGYELAAVLPWNAIFIDRRYFDRLGIRNNAPSQLRTDRSAITAVFWGYDGSFHMSGRKSVPWFELPLSRRGFDRVPGFLRQFPFHMSPFKRRVLRLYRKWLRWLV